MIINFYFGVAQGGVELVGPDGLIAGRGRMF